MFYQIKKCISISSKVLCVYNFSFVNQYCTTLKYWVQQISRNHGYNSISKLQRPDEFATLRPILLHGQARQPDAMVWEYSLLCAVVTYLLINSLALVLHWVLPMASNFFCAKTALYYLPGITCNVKYEILPEPFLIACCDVSWIDSLTSYRGLVDITILCNSPDI